MNAISLQFVGYRQDAEELVRRVDRLVAGAPLHLRRRGWLIMEIGDGQEQKVAALLRRSGAFGRPVFRRDLAGRTRVVEARRK